MQIDINPLLPKMTAFVRHLYHIKQDVQLEPRKEHIATCIEYSGGLEMREEFIEHMVVSVVRYVYSNIKRQQIRTRLIEDLDEEESDVEALIVRQAHKKFRKQDIKGQFSELLLYNLLLYHFKAVPLVRKMPITTNPNVERHGADAIHLANGPDDYVLYLGEAKTYTSGFKKALKAALESIIETHTNHRSEINLYVYEDFITPELEKVAEDYISGRNKDIEIELVCIITFEIDKKASGGRDAKLKEIVGHILDECSKIKASDYPEIDDYIKSKINYIIFPVNELNKLLEDFKTRLGI